MAICLLLQESIPAVFGARETVLPFLCINCHGYILIFLPVSTKTAEDLTMLSSMDLIFVSVEIC